MNLRNIFIVHLFLILIQSILFVIHAACTIHIISDNNCPLDTKPKYNSRLNVQECRLKITKLFCETRFCVEKVITLNRRNVKLNSE